MKDIHQQAKIAANTAGVMRLRISRLKSELEAANGLVSS